MTCHVHDLTVGTPVPGAPVIVAVHGITGNGLTWLLLARHLHERLGAGAVRVLAPDLRGRGDSPAHPGHHGLDEHVDDLAALVADLPAPPLVVGHSMGGAVTALLGAQHPGAVRGLVLVDGGLSFPLPPGLGDSDIDQTLRTVLGPALARLETTFAGPAAYLEFFADHPALGPLLAGPDASIVRAYLDHDLRPSSTEPGRYVSSCSLDAVRADGRDLLVHSRAAAAVREAVGHGVPVEFLWAARGLFDEPQGMYDEARLRVLAVPESVRVTPVEDTNHYSIVLSRKGVEAVAEAAVRLLG